MRLVSLIKRILGKEDNAMPSWLDANMKVALDNVITHEKMVMSYNELALKEAVEFQQKMNNEYLANAGVRQTAAMNQQTYLLDWLTSMYPPEAAGMGTYMTMLINALKGDSESIEKLKQKLAEMSKTPTQG